MKIFIAIVTFYITFSSVNAGLFEYTMGESTRINSTKYETADIIESVNIQGVKYVEDNSYHYTNTGNYNPYQNYTNSYNSDEITKQMQYYISIANGIRVDISKISRYGGDYIPLRNQLERDLDDLQDQIQYLSKLRSQNSYYGQYSYNYGYYNNTYSSRLLEYYKKYGYDYYTHAGSYYHYDRKYGYYQRKPQWLNENLRPRDEGYIYIK